MWTINDGAFEAFSIADLARDLVSHYAESVCMGGQPMPGIYELYYENEHGHRMHASQAAIDRLERNVRDEIEARIEAGENWRRHTLSLQGVWL